MRLRESNSPIPYTIDTLELGPMENIIYLITDNQSRNAAVVDPAWDPAKIVKLAKEKEVKITDILLTHSHQDHINGVENILEAFDARLHLSKAEAQFWGADLINPELHYGGEVIKVGDIQISILLTPGHTPGSACYYLDNKLISGDTLFVFGCGRCDLHGGDPNQMFDTLKKISTDLPADTITLPGHNYAIKTSCTLEEQISGNPFLHFSDKASFSDFRMHQHDLQRLSPYAPILKSEMNHFNRQSL